MGKWEKIKEISKACQTPYGSLLIELMDMFNKTNLIDVTEKDVLEFMNELRYKKMR